MKYSDSLSHLILQGIKKTSKNFSHGMGYHTDKHAVEVIDAAMEIVNSYPADYFKEQDKNSLFVAAAWHDAVYVPGNPNNESDSASKFTWYHGTSKTVNADLVSDLIRKTTISDHLSVLSMSELHDILLDSDLWALQLPFDDFVYRQALILKEHGLGEEHIDKNRDFLYSFLRKPTIYRTKYSIDNWETRAKSNIMKLNELCKNQVLL